MFIAAAAIVDNLDHPTRFLGAQRSYPAALAGKWELPGGKVEDGEDPGLACIRELNEELGITATLGRLVKNDGADWEIPVGTMRVWLAVTGDEPRPGRDHLQLAWLDKDSVLSVDWLEGDIPLARHIAANILHPHPDKE